MSGNKTEIVSSQGGGLAAGQVIVWLLGMYGVAVPPEIAIAFGTLLGGVGLVVHRAVRQVWNHFFLKDWKDDIENL